MISIEKCGKFMWQSEGHKFSANLRIIPTGGCDVILGHDWMWDHDPVTFHLKKNCLGLIKVGKKLMIDAEKDETSLKLMSGKGIKKLLQKTTGGIITQLFHIKAYRAKVDVPEHLQAILRDFEEVFQEQQDLPPIRSLEHKNEVKEGVKPMFIKPYRQSHFLKNEVERLVKEMLDQGLVSPSSSPFASL